MSAVTPTPPALRVLSVIPPMTQLNTPYPSTAYLTGWDDKTIHLYGKLGHVKEFARFSYVLVTTE